MPLFPRIAMKIKMKFSLPLLILLISFVSGYATPIPGDTSYIPTIRYSKKELKKEINDLKAFEKQIKEWQQGIKQNNLDYLNSMFSKTMSLLEKEHNELNNRISERSKQLSPAPSQAANSGAEDKPKVYNPELKDQIVHVNKEDVMRKKAEAEYLSKYIVVIRNEKNLITKLKNVKPFDAQTPSATLQEISSDIQAFKKEMNTEISLMEKETGKKK